MSTRKTTLFYAVLIAVASLAVGMVIASRLDLAPASSAQSVNVPATNSAPLNGPIDASTFRNIAKAQIPAVVNIRTEARARTRELNEFFGGGDDIFERFFGTPGAPRGRRPDPTPRGEDPGGPVTQGAGTGFVIDKAGFILTNNHVVEGADLIRVSLFNGGLNEDYAAKVVGRDPLTDSALIQLTEMPATPLHEVKFGDSALMEQGDWVMAIGNPFGLSHTVTVGVISATERTLFGSGYRGREQPMLQTDAAINPGNSGGPLLNIRGEVVGMATAIYTDPTRQANIGIGFATPINTLKDLVPQLRTGKVTRGMIGVQVNRAFSRAEADALGVKDGKGALITTVVPTGPAGRAGLEPGDVVVEFNGRPVENSDQLVSMVVATKPGTTVPVAVIRDKQRRTLNITVDELDLEAEAGGRAANDREAEEAERTATGFGMTIEPISPEYAREAELPRNRGGAVIVSIERNGPAFLAGLQRGDIILEVNRQAVNNASQVTKALQSTPEGSPVFLLIWRGGQEQFVTMTKR
jgi:serine protease Do